MNIVPTIGAALELLTAMLRNTARISEIVTAVQARGDTKLSAEEWAEILAHEDAAKAAENKAIQDAEGRDNAG